MSYNFQPSTTGWMLVGYTPDYVDGGRNPRGAPYAAGTDETWMRLELTIIRTRSGPIADPLGTSDITFPLAGNEVTWQDGGVTLSGEESQEFTCMSDPLVPDVQRTGFHREDQTWVFWDAWEIRNLSPHAP